MKEKSHCVANFVTIIAKTLFLLLSFKTFDKFN